MDGRAFTLKRSEAISRLVDLKKELVDAVARDGWTCLHTASSGGHLEVVKYLVDLKKEFVDAVDEQGRTYLWLFSRNLLKRYF